MSLWAVLESAFAVEAFAALSATETALASGGALLFPGTRVGIGFWAARPPPGGFCDGSAIVMFAVRQYSVVVDVVLQVSRILVGIEGLADHDCVSVRFGVRGRWIVRSRADCSGN